MLTRSLQLLCIIQAFHLGIVKSECYAEGKTWSNEAEVEVIVNVPNIQECIGHCSKNDECIGYTWHSGNSNFEKLTNVCILFANLTNEYSCQHCLSGKILTKSAVFWDVREGAGGGGMRGPLKN